VLQKKITHTGHVLTKKTLDNIGARIEASLKICYISWLFIVECQEVYSMLQKIVEICNPTKWQLYIVFCLHTVKQKFDTAGSFRNLCLMVYLTQNLTFYFDEAWFTLSGYVNSQNNRWTNGQQRILMLFVKCLYTIWNSECDLQLVLGEE
jgi:hypothetical protein